MVDGDVNLPEKRRPRRFMVDKDVNLPSGVDGDVNHPVFLVDGDINHPVFLVDGDINLPEKRSPRRLLWLTGTSTFRLVLIRISTIRIVFILL